MSKKLTLISYVIMAFIAFFSLSAGNAIAAIDGGYIGTAACLSCHPGEHAEFIESGHPYKFRQTNGADCGAGACDPITNLLPTPAIASISTLTNNALIIDDGSGYLDWSAIQYIIGGWGWKARFGMLDATDADGDGIDDTGYVWTGSAVQNNILAGGTWSGYHAGEDKAYNCGTCHNTNGTTDMLASRTEPWATIPGTGTGFTSQWTFDGVQCEACHGPGEAHEAAENDPYPTDTTKTLCGMCHHRSGADDHGADTKGGYIRHHEQFNESVGNSLEPGVHASLECIECHDPHKRSHTVPDSVATALGITDNDMTAEERGAVVSCASCHNKNVRYHSNIQCIDCHMAEVTKSATAEAGTYGKKGDVKSHIVKINPDPLAEDTAASPNSVTGTNVAHNYVTLNYACGKCHDSSMSTYAGVQLSMAELGNYANQIHTSPVNQNLGFPDIAFNALAEADCRVCHGVVADDHHMLYGTSIPYGECSVVLGTCANGDPCGVDDDCVDNSTCVPGAPVACLTDTDCDVSPENVCTVTGQLCTPGVTDCGSPWTGQDCGQPLCVGESKVPVPDSDSDGSNDTNYACLSCHEQTLVGGVITFTVTRDCTQCHVVDSQNEGSVHHLTGDAKAGVCTSCHGDFVDDKDDGHAIPTYSPSLVTPEPSSHGDAMCDDGITPCPNGWECGSGTCIEPATPAGGCNYCHDTGTDTGSGLDVINNHDTHHNAGVHKNELGGSDSAICAWCHKSGNPHAPGGMDADRIRVCENCHGYESLHNIQDDSPNPGNVGSIVVGAEDAGFGHVGANNPGGGDDCWGCHGFSTANVLPSSPTTPYISDSDTGTITAGTDAVVTLTGASFTNDAFTSDVVLTAANGSSVTIAPDSISVGSLTVTIPGTTAPGTYKVQAVKSGAASNPVVIIITPQVVITSTNCDEEAGTMTINGSGFGDPPPAGTEAYINVILDGASAEIISWADTQITISVPNCGEATVNTLLGSSSDGGSCTACSADSNNDGTINILDLVIMKNEYNSTGCNPCEADFNDDGNVNIFDLLIMKKEYSKSNCCIQ